METVIQIIIPVYNAEAHLEECLDSVAAQTFKEWEAFVINDASQDASADIIKRRAAEDKRFIYIENETNCGAAGTRNKGLERVSAEYVAFLDVDDRWEPEMLEHMLAAAKADGSDVVQCRYIYDLPGGMLRLPRGAFGKNTVLEGKGMRKIYRKMMTGISMNHVCMKLIRANLVRDLKFDESYATAEDLEFCINLFKNVKKYSFIDEVLYHYHRNAGSLTGGGISSRQKLDANRRVARVMVDALDEWGIDNLFYRLLSYGRPYIIIFSKIFRTAAEKFTKAR